MDRPVPQISLKEQRERTVRTLCDHFAHDTLDVEEFEARLDRAHRARLQEELTALVQDLPALRPATGTAQARGASQHGDVPVRSPHGRRSPAPRGRESRTLVAIMSGVERRGAWQPAERMQVMAFMGGVDLDFRDALLPAGVTEISVFCMMGGVEIIVPPGVIVDMNGFAIMGAFENRAPAVTSDPDAPVLRIDGFCMMGGVDVQVRRSGESARDARRRAREEKKLGRTRHRLDGGSE